MAVNDTKIEKMSKIVSLTGAYDKKVVAKAPFRMIGIAKNEIKRHLIGNDTFGIYPLLKGDYCRLPAVDFDDEDYKESAKAFSNVCNNHHLDNLIEISSSGYGAHVWLFFDKPIKRI